MPHDEIQLNRIILPKERRLTRRGIVYYSWVKSSRRNCFYLLPLKKCEKYVRLAGGAAFISAVLFLTFRMFYEPGKWRDFLIAGGVLNGLTLLLTFSYCRNAVRTLRLLPRLPIAVADLDRGVLKIRNLSNLPFLQTPGRRWQVEISSLQYCRIDSAYMIRNGREKIWNYFGYSPTWSALFVGFGKTADRNRRQLLFVGSRIPENIFQFFTLTLSLQPIRNADYSRFDR